MTRQPYPYLIRTLGQHPVVAVPGSKWVIVGAVGANWKQLAEGADADKPVALEVHFDADDPLWQWLDEAVADPDQRIINRLSNKWHRKAYRLRSRRSRDFDPEHSDDLKAIEAARLRFFLTQVVRANPSANVTVTVSGEPRLGLVREYPNGELTIGWKAA